MLTFFKNKLVFITKTEVDQRKERAQDLLSLLDQVSTTTHNHHSVLEDGKFHTLLVKIRHDILDRIFSKKIWYTSEYETLRMLLQSMACCYGSAFDYYRDLLYHKYGMGDIPNPSSILPKDLEITSTTSNTPIGRIYLDLRDNQGV